MNERLLCGGAIMVANVSFWVLPAEDLPFRDARNGAHGNSSNQLGRA